MTPVRKRFKALSRKDSGSSQADNDSSLRGSDSGFCDGRTVRVQRVGGFSEDESRLIASTFTEQGVADSEP